MGGTRRSAMPLTNNRATGCKPISVAATAAGELARATLESQIPPTDPKKHPIKKSLINSG